MPVRPARPQATLCVARSRLERRDLVRLVREPTRDRATKDRHDADEQHRDERDEQAVLGDRDTRLVAAEPPRVGEKRAHDSPCDVSWRPKRVKAWGESKQPVYHRAGPTAAAVGRAIARGTRRLTGGRRRG